MSQGVVGAGLSFAPDESGQGRRANLLTLCLSSIEIYLCVCVWIESARLTPFIEPISSEPLVAYSRSSGRMCYTLSTTYTHNLSCFFLISLRKTKQRGRVSANGHKHPRYPSERKRSNQRSQHHHAVYKPNPSLSLFVFYYSPSFQTHTQRSYSRNSWPQ